MVTQNDASHVKNFIQKVLNLFSKISIVLLFASIILLGVMLYFVFSIKFTDDKTKLLEKASLLPNRANILMIVASILFLLSRILSRYKYFFASILFRIKINSLNFDYISYVKSVQVMSDGLFYDDDYEFCKIVKILVAPSTEFRKIIKSTLGVLSVIAICIFGYLGISANIENYAIALSLNLLENFSFSFSKYLIIALVIICLSMLFLETDVIKDIKDVSSWVLDYQKIK